MTAGTLTTILAAAGIALSAHGVDIAIDFNATTGKMKPVHSTGQGPLLGGPDFSMFRYLKEAGVPYARLHDVGGLFGQNLWVVAAKGEKGVAAFVVNDSPKKRPVTVDFGGCKPVSCRLTDGEHTDEEITDIPSEAVLPPHSIVLVNFE